MTGRHDAQHTPDPEHAGVRGLLGMLAIGRLEGAEAVAARAHLDGCGRCRAELAELTGTASQLSRIDPERATETVPVPPELGDRVIAAVQSERTAHQERDLQQHAVDELAARRSGRVRRAAPLVAAAAVLAVVAGGVGYAVAPRPAEIPLETVAVETSDTGLVVTGAGVVPHTWGMEIKLTASGFSAGEDYQVQVLTDSGGQVQAGAFIGTGDSELRCNLNSSVLRSDAESFRVLDSDGTVVLTSTL